MNNEQTSACCGAEILGADSDGHGKCADCKENTTPYEPTEEEKPVDCLADKTLRFGILVSGQCQADYRQWYKDEKKRNSAYKKLENIGAGSFIEKIKNI